VASRIFVGKMLIFSLLLEGISLPGLSYNSAQISECLGCSHL
jgi:hypothetical protein